MIIEIEVTGCYDCPMMSEETLSQVTLFQCNHPDFNNGCGKEISHIEPERTPEWCPVGLGQPLH